MSRKRKHSPRHLVQDDEPSLVFEEKYEELVAKLQLAKNHQKPLFEASPEKPCPRRSTVARAIFKNQSVVTSTPMICNRKLTFNSDSQDVSPIDASSSTVRDQKSKAQDNTSIQKGVSKTNPKNISHISLSSISDDIKQTASKSKNLDNIVSKLVSNSPNKTSKMVQTSNKILNTVKKLARNSTHIIKERQTQTGVSLMKNAEKRLSPSSSSGTSDLSDFVKQCERSNLLSRNILKEASLSSQREISINTAAPWRAPSGLCNNSPLVVNNPQMLSESSSLDETFRPKVLPKKKVFTNKRKLNKKRQSTNKTKIHTSVSTVPATKDKGVGDKSFPQPQMTRAMSRTEKRDMATSTNEKREDPNVVKQRNNKSTSIREQEAVNPSPQIKNVQITSPERVNLLERERIVTRSAYQDKPQVQLSCSTKGKLNIKKNVKTVNEQQESFPVVTHEIEPVQSEEVSFDLNRNKNKKTTSQVENEVNEIRSPPSTKSGKKSMAESRKADPSLRENLDESVCDMPTDTVSHVTRSRTAPGKKRGKNTMTDNRKDDSPLRENLDESVCDKPTDTVSHVTRSRATPGKKRGKKTMTDNRKDDLPLRENSDEVSDTPPDTVSHVTRTDKQNGEIELMAKQSPTKPMHSDKFTNKKEKKLRVTLVSVDDSIPNAASSSSKKDETRELKSKSRSKSTLTVSRSSSQVSLDNGSLRRSTRERKPPPQRCLAGFVGTRSTYLYKLVTRDNSVRNISKNLKKSFISSSRTTVISPIREIDEFETDDDYLQPSTSTNTHTAKSVSSGRVSKRRNKRNSVTKICNGARENTTKKNKCPNSQDICDSIKIRNRKLIFKGPIEELPLVDGVGMVITGNDPVGGLSTGYMKIAPGGHKPKEVTNIHNMAFMVLEGRAQVGIQNNATHIYSKHHVFFVMKGDEYFIKNMSTKEHLLLSFSRVVVQDLKV